MFSSNRNIETISQLVVEIKRHLELRGKSLQISFVSKLTRLFAALVLGALLFLFGGLALLFVSMMLVATLAAYLGSAIPAIGIVVLVYVFLGVLVYVQRRRWIEAPLANFLAGLFLDKETLENATTNHSSNPETHDK